MELANLNSNNHNGLDQANWVNLQPNQQMAGSKLVWQRLRASLQKYSFAFCLIEALALALVVGYLLLNSPFPPSSQLDGCKHDEAAAANATIANSKLDAASVRIYPDKVGRQAKLRVGLVEGCNQKVHDIRHDVKCYSSHIELCPTLKDDVSSESPGGFGTRLEGNMANVVVTSKAGDRMKSSWIPLARFTCKSQDPSNLKPQSQSQDPCRYRTVLQVDVTKERQRVLGWGGAMTDSTINNILALSTNGTKRLLDDYFGDDGLRMNMVRVSIGGSDFSSRFYTNQDFSTNSNLKGGSTGEPPFELTEEDTLYKIPILRYIQQEYGGKPDRRPLRFFASMWSPPIWMKTNEHFNKGYLKGHVQTESGQGSSFNDTYYKKLAKLKKNFLSAYREQSIKFWGLTVMNEPIFAIQPFLNFNTMIFPKDDYANYVANYLGPTIKNDGTLKHIKLMVHDDNRRYLLNYTDDILKNKLARPYIDGISTHGYIDEDYHLMNEIQLRHASPKKPLFVLPTELCSGHLPFMEKATLGNWNRGIHYGLDIIRGLQNSAAGWVDWNMALDMTGGPGWLGGRLDSPVIVDKLNDVYHKSPMFYIMGQFSRYIQPASVRLETTITNSDYDFQFETVTFANGDNQLITVILNNNPYPIDLYLKMVGSDYIPGGTFLVQCQPDSVTTVTYSSSIGSP